MNQRLVSKEVSRGKSKEKAREKEKALIHF